jgi:hypothetical protein
MAVPGLKVVEEAVVVAQYIVVEELGHIQY